MKDENKSALPSVGKRIREERRRRGLTQRALADAIEMSEQFISNLERGSRMPATKTLQAIAGALQIKVEDLFAGTPTTVKPLDADLTALASILRDASPQDRARVINVARSLIKPKKSRK